MVTKILLASLWAIPNKPQQSLLVDLAEEPDAEAIA